MCKTKSAEADGLSSRNGQVPKDDKSAGTSFFDRLGTARKRSLPSVILVHLAIRMKYCFLQWFGLKALLRYRAIELHMLI